MAKRRGEEGCFDIHLKFSYSDAKAKFVGNKLEGYSGRINNLIVDALYQYIKNNAELFETENKISVKEASAKKPVLPAIQKKPTEQPVPIFSSIDTVYDSANESYDVPSDADELLKGLELFNF